MGDELLKLLLQAGVDTLLAVALIIAIYYLSKGKSAQTKDEAETGRKREENEGKLIDAAAKSSDAIVEIKTSFIKMVELQIDINTWHKSHDSKLEDTNSKLDTLGRNVKERSELDGQAIEELREDVDQIKSTVDDGFKSVKADIEQLHNQIRELIDDKLKCADVDNKFDKILQRFDDLAKAQPPTNAVSTNVISVDASTLAAEESEKDEAA